MVKTRFIWSAKDHFQNDLNCALDAIQKSLWEVLDVKYAYYNGVPSALIIFKTS